MQYRIDSLTGGDHEKTYLSQLYVSRLYGRSHRDTLRRRRGRGLRLDPAGQEDSIYHGGRAVKLPKLSSIHCPVHRIKVKKTYYRAILVIGGIGMYYAHHHIPEHEVTIAVLLNTLFAIDPTV